MKATAYQRQTVVAATVPHKLMVARLRRLHQKVDLSGQEILHGVAIGQGYGQIAEQLALPTG